MLSTEKFKLWLKEAKDAHTIEFGHDPNHDWLTYYADHMFLNYLEDQVREASGVIGLVKLRQIDTTKPAVPIIYTSGKPSKVISDFIRDPDNTPDPADYAATRVENPHRAG